MANCSIAILAISGIDRSLSPNTCRMIVTVFGTLSFDEVYPCGDVVVTVSCPCNGAKCHSTCTVNKNGVLTGSNVISGYLIHREWQISMEMGCCCNEIVEVVASCPSCGCQDQRSLSIQCDDRCCPQVTSSVSYGPCDANFKVPTTFTINLTATSFSDCVVIGKLVFGDGTQSTPHTFTGTSSFTWPAHNYTPGAHVAHFVIEEPRCMFVSLPITVPCTKQNCCPAIVTSAEYGECNSDGRAPVILTATVTVPAVCQPATVRMDFNDGGPLGGLQTFAAPGGTFIEYRTYSAGPHTGYVLVDSPKGCDATPFKIDVPCEESDCCPILEPSVTYGPCDSHGSVPATLTVAYFIPDGCGTADVLVVYGDGGQGSVHTLSGSGNFTEPPHLYAPGDYIAEVRVITPWGCDSEELAIHAQCPPPPCCPQISTAVSYGPCNMLGVADVTIATTVTPAADPHCPVPEVQYDFGGGHLGAVHSGAGTFQVTLPYAVGPHVAMLNILSPPGCGMMPVGIHVRCLECCPDVTVTPCIRDCENGPERTVTFAIKVAPKPAPCPSKPVTFRMDFGDGDAGQQVTIPANGGSYSYNETHTYTGQHAKHANTAALIILEPPECAGNYGDAEIAACCKKKRAKFCNNLFASMSWSFTLALFFFLFTFGTSTPTGCTTACYPLGSYILVKYASFVFSILGFVVLIIYLIFCTKCLCNWLNRLIWRAFSGAGLMYAIYAGCGLGYVSLIIAGFVLLIAYWALRGWKRNCCVSDCHYRREIVRWIVLTVLLFVATLTAFGYFTGCQFTLFSFTILGTTIHITMLGLATAFFGPYALSYIKDCT